MTVGDMRGEACLMWAAHTNSYVKGLKVNVGNAYPPEWFRWAPERQSFSIGIGKGELNVSVIENEKLTNVSVTTRDKPPHKPAPCSKPPERQPVVAWANIVDRYIISDCVAAKEEAQAMREKKMVKQIADANQAAKEDKANAKVDKALANGIISSSALHRKKLGIQPEVTLHQCE